MFPKLFHLPFLDSDVHTYGVLVAIAFLAALWLAGRLARDKGLNARFGPRIRLFDFVSLSLYSDYRENP